MLINSFIPTRNLVLVKTIYKVKGMILNTEQKEIALQVLDKIVVNVGPEVNPQIKVGDAVAITERAYNVDIIGFNDNHLSVPKMREVVKKEVAEYNGKISATNLGLNNNLRKMQIAANDPNNPIMKEYIVHGYITVPESDIIGIVNKTEDEPELPVESKPSIILPVN